MSRPGVILGVLAIAILPTIAQAARFRVEFSGQVRRSHDFRFGSTTTQFELFAVGTPFAGSFLFDSDLITRDDRYNSAAGVIARYASAIREYEVVYDNNGETYRYAPPLFGDGRYTTNNPLTSWRLADDVSGGDWLDLRLHNYPATWPTAFGRPRGEVTPDQYFGNLYPHSSFFTIFDQDPPADTVPDINDPVIDVQRLFDESTSADFTIRFTSPTHSRWREGAEALIGVVNGDILQLNVITIPEPGAAMMLIVSGIVWLTSFRRETQSVMKK